MITEGKPTRILPIRSSASCSFILGSTPPNTIPYPKETKRHQFISYAMEVLKISRNEADEIADLSPDEFYQMTGAGEKLRKIKGPATLDIVKAMYREAGREALRKRLKNRTTVNLEVKPYNPNIFEDPWGALVTIDHDNKLKYDYDRASWIGGPAEGGEMIIDAIEGEILAAGHACIKDRSRSLRKYMVLKSDLKIKEVRKFEARSQLLKNRKYRQVFL